MVEESVVVEGGVTIQVDSHIEDSGKENLVCGWDKGMIID